MHQNFIGRQADYILEALTAPADYSLPSPQVCSKTLLAPVIILYGILLSMVGSRPITYLLSGSVLIVATRTTVLTYS